MVRPSVEVRSGSIATEMGCPRYVRFFPDSYRRTDIAGCLKPAISDLTASLDHIIGAARPWLRMAAAFHVRVRPKDLLLLRSAYRSLHFPSSPTAPNSAVNSIASH